MIAAKVGVEQEVPSTVPVSVSAQKLVCEEFSNTMTDVPHTISKFSPCAATSGNPRPLPLYNPA
jgi:hypothetical protein